MAAAALPQEAGQLHLHPLAEFKPSSTSRAWASVPNPNNLPLLATATSDKTVRVYSLSNFTLHSTLEGGHSRSVRSVAWKPARGSNNALSLATGSFDATIGVWRRREEGNVEGMVSVVQSNKEIKRGYVEDDQEEDMLEVEILRDGRPKTQDREHGSDTDEDWEFAIVLEGHDSEVKSIAYSPSGQWLASCSRDKSIWIWEEIGDEGEDEFETVAVLQEHTADVKSVCWRKDDGNGEVLASASYDDTIRLWREDGEGEWGCFAVLEGHDGTVWDLDWEPEVSQRKAHPDIESMIQSKGDDNSESQTHTTRNLEEALVPRLISSSADSTIRIWSLAPSPPPPNRPSYFNPSIPSTMRPSPSTETWSCTATLPKVHDLPIYSVNWSKSTGRVVSTGGDGRVAIYEEASKGRTMVGGDVKWEWVVVCILEGAHGPYEINHAAWCTRFDAGKKGPGEEMVITTGDDGSVKAWAIVPEHEGNVAGETAKEKDNAIAV